MIDVILLTACVNPCGMPMTKVSDASIRLSQYLRAMNFYLRHTSCPIVFVDNSNVDRSVFSSLECQYRGRLEILIFDGNNDKTRGKGYGEMEIIDFALTHSMYNLRRPSSRIMKITGRLLVRNITKVLTMDRLGLYPRTSIVCQMNTELSFADSRMFIATGSFLQTLVEQKNRVYDAHGVYFEHILCDLLKSQQALPYSPFFTELSFDGVSGSTGLNYIPQHRSFSYQLRFLDFQLYIQKTFVSHQYAKRPSLFRRFLYTSLHGLCKAILRICSIY